MMARRRTPRDGRAAIAQASLAGLRKLHPRVMMRNPVMCVVWVGAAVTTLLAATGAEGARGFAIAISAWLWLTVWFANFAEALAEGRGRAHADALRSSRVSLEARRLRDPADPLTTERIAASALQKGDVFVVEAGELIAADGEVIDGIASVDESAVTGESAPVIRESGGDRTAVTAGTRVISDWLIVRVTANQGESFLDRMIGLIEAGRRRKTPNEVALEVLLAALSLVFLLAVATLLPFSLWSVESAGRGAPVTLTVLIALLVCLIPTTIGGLLSAIGIAGMDRMIRQNVIATSGRAVEAAGDVDVLLLDKTGTITLGNRQAAAFLPAHGVDVVDLARAASLASAADETPEGRSIVAFAHDRHQVDPAVLPEGAVFIPFTAETRMSGVDMGGRAIRKGAVDAVARATGAALPADVEAASRKVAAVGGTPLVVIDGARVLGVIELKDIVKAGIRDRFDALRRMGIRTVMITGDNPLTAASIAAEAGVDDYLAQATPEDKLRLIREYQAKGHLVAMTGDGTNDAPALAQADVAVAMNSGTPAAKEAGNMIDLDSNPTKLLEVVETGKQMLVTRGALTTFSTANDVAKYFAILPAAFAGTYPSLAALDIMRLASPQSAVLAAVIFNALIIVALVPLALRGVRVRPVGAAQLLRRNLLIYGVGGLVAPFLGIKLIDLALVALRLT
ncbi:MAG: potassium-transporting ATPase subunit KdpB [Gemmatimonadetes bacterium]|nr:potassium-transporting ATPase subunit KdpB [Gemmatimonadota bacterium]